jgi:hypothetical protein
MDRKQFEAFSWQQQRGSRTSAPAANDDQIVHLHLLTRDPMFKSLYLGWRCFWSDSFKNVREPEAGFSAGRQPTCGKSDADHSTASLALL